MNVSTGSVAPSSSRQVCEPSVLTCQRTEGSGVPSARAVRATSSPAFTERSAGAWVTRGETCRVSRVIFPSAGLVTKTVAPPGATASEAAPSCDWLPGSERSFAAGVNVALSYTVSVPSLSLAGSERSPPSCHTTKARPLSVSKAASRARSLPISVFTGLPEASKTSTDRLTPTHTAPVAGSVRMNPAMPSAPGRSKVSATVKETRSTRCSFPAATSLNQTAPRAWSAANRLPPGTVTLRVAVPVAVAISESFAPCATSTVPTAVPGAMSVIVDPASQTPEAALSPALALPTPRSG
ncbi:hypothetical protein SCYAM73S_02111 [Streptomyces cyaneofuscatus]